MAESFGEHVLVVPQPLAGRLDQMVKRGEFQSFAQAAVAMIELGIAQHDGRVLPPAAGPPPPAPPGRDIPPPGPPAKGPALAASKASGRPLETEKDET